MLIILGDGPSGLGVCNKLKAIVAEVKIPGIESNQEHPPVKAIIISPMF